MLSSPQLIKGSFIVFVIGAALESFFPIPQYPESMHEAGKFMLYFGFIGTIATVAIKFFNFLDKQK